MVISVVSSLLQVDQIICLLLMPVVATNRLQNDISVYQGHVLRIGAILNFSFLTTNPFPFDFILLLEDDLGVSQGNQSGICDEGSPVR